MQQILPRLSYIVSVYFNQADRDHFLTVLLRQYESYPKEIMQYIQFVIVDDGSPQPVALPKDINLNIKLLRILQDIAWNSDGGRNLGVVYAPTSKILLTDIDHDFPPELLAMMLKAKTPTNELYTFK
ncbi:MAG: hypothetical protein LBB53_05520, partial [Prevotellaceae bacterium]|nr:hypothetical protein [Prevotellaceae bacterium]